MKITRRLVCALLVLITVLSMVPAVWAKDDAASYIRQMISYYQNYQEDAETDIARLTAELAEIDEAQAEAWGRIMDFWSYVNSEMEIPTGELPDGLPEDDSLCIVVLGYQLNPYGTIKPELTGRLEVALESAKKYPNAYILCTGGATASRTKKKTEAGQMANWLKKRGISEDRIIVEDQAYSTLENAKFACQILSEEYPQVQHLALISSDYHVPRGCVYLYTQSVINALEQGTQELDVVACAAYKTSRPDTEGIATQAQGVEQIAGVSVSAKEKPVLSKPTKLEVDGEYTYNAGTATSLTVEAFYNTGFSRDVTTSAVFSGVDMNQPGEQLLTVTYTENGTTVTAELLIDVISAPAVKANIVKPKPVIPAQESSAVSPASSGSPAPMWPFVALALLLALLALLIRLKILRNE